ncbi:unnamed protein product [Cylindrotheca closterium]|uniref:Pumilio domain-containing protein NOP9 n=1 Tax=Cylindrotheca closterium TaxID=2856 RepID=A0AAD2CAU2_9STRA|nr:unnamed protein product [Cylindrotheca closterium]
MGDNRDDPGDYARPRRPDTDTISYLRGLPLDVDQAKQEISSYLEHGGEFPQTLVATFSAIDEICMEIASLAGDEFGSQGVELLAHISAPHSELASRILLNACSGYHLHLATHRYGSHVVQTILQLAFSSASEKDLASDPESPSFDNSSTDDLPSLAELVQGMVEELSPHTSSLAVHVCGSHVLRTLLCVLGGVDLVTSGNGSDNRFDSGAILRGRKKNKKKKKKKPDADSSAGIPHAGTMSVIYRSHSRVNPNEFTSSLEAMTNAVIGEHGMKEPGELQQLASHPSAGPLLIVLFRVLTYSTEDGKKQWEALEAEKGDSIADFRLGIARQEPTFATGTLAHRMACQILCWDEDVEEQPHAGDIIFGLSGEPRGSHLLETLLRLAPDEMHNNILQCGGFFNPTAMQEYCEHQVSNFVVQTLLTTIRTKEQAETMLKVVEKVISSGLAVDGTKKRRGILWRTVELASKFRVGQDGILKAVRLGFAAISKSTTATEESAETEQAANDQDQGEEEGKNKKKKQRKKATSVEVKDCVKSLLGVQLPEKEGDRLTLDATGARAVYHMLRFTPRLCEDVLKGCIDEHSVDELVAMAKDGLGSRCVMDGILSGPTKTPIFAAASKNLYKKLTDHWVSLSIDRVGHHIVKKLFEALLKIDDKSMLVEELVNGGRRLTANKMGHSVSEACMVDIYRENPKQWRKKIVSTQDKSEDTFLKEMTSASGEGGQASTKPKRKRKRKKKETSTEEESATKKTSFPSSSVDSIINAITAS